MNMKSMLECEKRSGQKFLNFKLPNFFKKIGWIGFALVFIFLLSTKFFDGEYEVLKTVLKKVSLIFLLVVVFSKEKVEDEMIQKIRAQSFSFAFLGGVLYALAQPFINFLVFLVVKPEKNRVVEDLGDFQILWFMLVVYLMFFYVTKKSS